MSEVKPWKTLSSEVVVDNDRLKIRRDTCLLPNGSMVSDYYVREERDAAIVFCVTRGSEVVFVRQYRHAVGEVTLELPAGQMNRHDHSLEDTARRELLEEAGYASDVVDQVARWFTNAGQSTGQVSLFLAREADRVAAPKNHAREFTEVVLVPLPQVKDLLRRGELRTVGQVAATLAALDHLSAAGAPLAPTA